MGVQNQGLAQLTVDVQPLLPLSGVPLAAGTQSNSKGIRTLSYTVGGLEEGCLQAQNQRASEVTRNLGSIPATALLSLVCQQQPQSVISQHHNMAAEAPGFTSRCHNAQRQKRSSLPVMILS